MRRLIRFVLEQCRAMSVARLAVLSAEPADHVNDVGELWNWWVRHGGFGQARAIDSARDLIKLIDGLGCSLSFYLPWDVGKRHDQLTVLVLDQDGIRRVLEEWSGQDTGGAGTGVQRARGEGSRSDSAPPAAPNPATAPSRAVAPRPARLPERPSPTAVRRGSGAVEPRRSITEGGGTSARPGVLLARSPSAAADAVVEHSSRAQLAAVLRQLIANGAVSEAAVVAAAEAAATASE